MTTLRTYRAQATAERGAARANRLRLNEVGSWFAVRHPFDPFRFAVTFLSPTTGRKVYLGR